MSGERDAQVPTGHAQAPSLADSLGNVAIKSMINYKTVSLCRLFCPAINMCQSKWSELCVLCGFSKKSDGSLLVVQPRGAKKESVVINFCTGGITNFLQIRNENKKLNNRTLIMCNGWSYYTYQLHKSQSNSLQLFCFLNFHCLAYLPECNYWGTNCPGVN